MSQQQNQQNQNNEENETRQQNPYAQAGYGYGGAGAYNPYGAAAGTGAGAAEFPYYGGYVDPSQQYGYGYQPQQAQAYPGYQQPTAGFQYPQFPTTPDGGQVPGMLPLEQSYIENILRLNRGKLATVYMTFENNREWNAKIFKGVIEAAGRDHIILSDPQTGMRYLLLMVYLDYVTFDEELDYDYPYSAAPISTYPPR